MRHAAHHVANRPGRRRRRAVRVVSVAVVAFWGVASTAGCSADGHAQPAPSRTPVAAADPRGDLTRRVAAAKDRRFTATYTWTGAGPRRTVTVAIAVDGTWRVDVPGGALGGQATIALVGRTEGVYQCASAGCVRIAKAAGTVPSGVDPKVHHPFTDWLIVLTDRDAAVSVAVAQQLPGSTGTCFSVEPTTVAIAPPIDAGIFCYDDSGLPTAVRAGFGTLVLDGVPGPGPATAVLAGPTSDDAPLGTAAADQPSASPSHR